MRLLLALVFVWGLASTKLISWDSEDFVRVRKEMLDWFRTNGPPPKIACSSKDNQDALQKYTQAIHGKECVKEMTSFQNLMLSAANTPFVGINETLMALRSSAVHILYIGSSKHISVYDYRNPTTGSHIYQVCEGDNCDSRKEITDGTDYGTYLLSSCSPLPKFVNNRYGKRAPTIRSTFCSSDIFKSVGELGGILRHGFLFHASLSPQTYHPTQPRKHRVVIKSES